MDIGIIIAVVGSSIAMIGVVISMMFWVRSESNSLRQEMKEDRKDMLQLTRNIESVIVAIKDEMKDFHNRLFKLEQERK